MTKQITRIGAYGIILNFNQMILTTKKSGAYKGLLDLPGGAIEFGESAKETLKRELLEEVAMECTHLHLFDNFSYLGQHFSHEGVYDFHHLGLIYLVKGFKSLPHLIPEDIFNWYDLSQLSLEKLTPIAKQTIQKMFEDQIVIFQQR